MDKKDLGNMILEGGIEGLVISLLHSFTNAAKEHGAEYLKSKVFGLGTNDEHLFLSACAYALKEKMLTSDELTKVCQVIDSYESSQRSRIVCIIGKEESDVVIETPKLDADGNIVLEKKTQKPVVSKTTVKANVKGAQMLGMLGKLDETGIKNILNTSGASASFMTDLNKKATATVTAVQSSQIKRDGDTLFTKETWLERVAREAKAKRGII